MKKYIKQVKKGLAALLAVVMVMGVSPVATVMAEELGAQPREGYVLFKGEPGWYFIMDRDPVVEEIEGQEKLSIALGTTVYTFVPPTESGGSNPAYYWYIFAPGVPDMIAVGPSALMLNREGAAFAAFSQNPTAPGSNYVEGSFVFDTVGTYTIVYRYYTPETGPREQVSFRNVVEPITSTGTQSPANPIPETQATAIADIISVTINGTTVNFTDQQPTNIDGRILVPVRGVFESLGFDVSWNGDLRQATLARANDTIVITVDSATFTINGTSHTLDVPAQSIGGRTMIPLRAVLESVGYSLDWDGKTQTVVIVA